MREAPAWALAVVAGGVAGLLAGTGSDRWAPGPVADVRRGSEEAFAQGLEPRELPTRGSPQRWTKPRARILFANLPAGPASLELTVRHHRTPVAVTADGMLVAEILPGATGGSYALGRLRRPTLEIELRTTGRLDRLGRSLGTQLERVAVLHAPSTRPPRALLLWFGAVGVSGAALALLAGLTPLGAGVVGAALSVLLAVGLAPFGLVRSAYAVKLPLQLLGTLVVAGLFGRWSATRWRGSGAWAFGAVLVAGIVQGVAAVSPLLVTSDAPFHANNLLKVSWGELLLTSITPHRPPFRFPYGVSFYLVLMPFAHAGIDLLFLVRWGAALSGMVASLGLFVLLAPSSARQAGLAVMLLQLLPESFVHYSYGSLSNLFGQSMAALFFCWWAGAAPLGAAAGSLLWMLAGLAHVSSLIVLSMLCVFLVLLHRRGWTLDRTRGLALAIGLGMSIGYYVQFLPLIAQQAPRLLDGPGTQGSSLSLWGALASQAGRAIEAWGLPATALALLGRPRPGGSGREREFAALWLTGGVLFIVAVASPLEVRYLYALTLAVAVAAASGFLKLWERGTFGRLAALGLLAAQATLASRGLLEALLFRYRP